MPELSRHAGDLHVTGTISGGTTSLSSGAVLNASVAANAGIDADKLEHRFQKVVAQESGTTSATEDRVVHVVHGTTGTVVAFEAGSVTACAGAATITVDLHKNGTTILSAPITLNSSSTAYIVQTATISSASLADGDVLEVVIVATAGGGTLGNGVFASVQLDEDAA